MSKPILASFTVMGPLIWYVNAQVRMWIILDINYKHYYHLGKSQICAGAGDYFRTSKPHSEKLWAVSVLLRLARTSASALCTWRVCCRGSSGVSPPPGRTASGSTTPAPRWQRWGHLDKLGHCHDVIVFDATLTLQVSYIIVSTN